VNKEIQQLLARVRKQGFLVRKTRRNHYRVSRGGGRPVTVPGTPRSRSIDNAKADLKRIGAEL
jgi:hypothetical protein